jgi:DNA-directed RNA polymerase specialized sigma24 family protein
LRPWFLAIVANQCRTRRRTRWWSVITVPAIRLEADLFRGDVDSDLDLDRELRKLSATERAALLLFYNFERPHGALAGQTPYERLRQATRASV